MRRLTVAALVVTNRPWFLPWWTRQISKQTRRPDEVVVVTNAPAGALRIAPHARELLEVEDTLVYCQPPEPWVSLGYLRQKALDLARSDVIAWFDDDDWYHPRRLELSVAPIEADYVDVSCFPLTHSYFSQEEKFQEYPEISGYALPSTTWRRELAQQRRFPHVPATEERGWIHPLLHGCLGADGKLQKPIIPPHRHHYESTYVGLPGSVGGVVVVHGANTWTYRKSASQFCGSQPTSWPARAPKDVSAEDWRWSKLFLGDFLWDGRTRPKCE